jgi:hypothetical protein
LGPARLPHPQAHLRGDAARWAFLHLPEERKAFLFAAAPDVFVTSMWGKTANLIVQIEHIPVAELRNLIHEAWQYASPALKTDGARVNVRSTTKAPRWRK